MHTVRHIHTARHMHTYKHTYITYTHTYMNAFPGRILDFVHSGGDRRGEEWGGRQVPPPPTFPVSREKRKADLAKMTVGMRCCRN